MESDISQIKILLWVILGLQFSFVVSNIACRFLGCGGDGQPKYKELVAKGKYDKILSHTKARLETHPDDTDALFFRAKALLRAGLTESGKDCIRRLGEADVRLNQASKEWLESIDRKSSGDS